MLETVDALQTKNHSVTQ